MFVVMVVHTHHCHYHYPLQPEEPAEQSQHSRTLRYQSYGYPALGKSVHEDGRTDFAGYSARFVVSSLCRPITPRECFCFRYINIVPTVIFRGVVNSFWRLNLSTGLWFCWLADCLV